MDCSSSRSRHKLDSSVTEGVMITEMEPGGSLVLQLLLTDMSEELMKHESGFLFHVVEVTGLVILGTLVSCLGSKLVLLHNIRPVLVPRHVVDWVPHLRIKQYQTPHSQK